MNFCKDCKYIEKHLYYWCTHPSVVKHNYVSGEFESRGCYFVRDNNPDCKMFEKKETFWGWLRSKL